MTTIMASFSAEALKLRKRPATRVLGLVLIGIIILFGYVSGYMISEREAAGGEREFLEALLRPENAVPVVLTMLKSIGAPIALILGAVAAGSEYSWSTLKTVLAQQPRRASVALGAALGLSLLLAVIVVLAFAAAIASSLVVALLQEAPSGLPALWDVLRGIAAGWLILSVWGMLGLALGHLTRGPAPAVSLGLIYGLLIEIVIESLGTEIALLAALRSVLPGPNAAALINTFALAGTPPQPQGLIDPFQALGVLSGYIVVCTGLAALLLRRDVAS